MKYDEAIFQLSKFQVRSPSLATILITLGETRCYEYYPIKYYRTHEVFHLRLHLLEQTQMLLTAFAKKNSDFFSGSDLYDFIYNLYAPILTY